MKFIDDEHYEVTAPDLSWSLPEKYETIEDAVKAGKEHDAKVIEHGYSPSAWIVVRKTWCRCLDKKDGSFITENTSTIKMCIDSYL